MAHAEVLRLDRPELQSISRVRLAQVVALHAGAVTKLHLDQIVGERRRVDGNVQVPQQVGERSGVIFVAVRDEHSAHAVGVLDEVGRIRKHKVDAMHVGLGKHQPCVDDDDVVAVLDAEHVLSNFAEAPKGDDAEGERAHQG